MPEWLSITLRACVFLHFVRRDPNFRITVANVIADVLEQTLTGLSADALLSSITHSVLLQL